MSQSTDPKLDADLAENFRQLNDFIGNKYTDKHRSQMVDLILHSIFITLPNYLVQLPQTGNDAEHLDSSITEATTHFIDNYAYKLWPRCALEAEEDFEKALRWILDDFKRNAFRIKTDAYAARDIPMDLKEALKIPEKEKTIQDWMDKVPLLTSASKRTMFGHIKPRSRPLRESKSDGDLYLVHARQNDNGESWGRLARER